MKIAFISLGFNPVRLSGLDISGERLVRGLVEHGHKLTVIASGRKPASEVERHPNLHVYRLPIGISDWIGFSARAARLLHHLDKIEPFDVKHFWDVYFAYAYRGRFLASLQHSFSQRLRYQRASLPRRGYFILAQYLAERPALERARGLLAGSATTQEEYINYYKVPETKTALAKHGIDTETYHPGIDARPLRRKWGLDNDTPVIMFAGWATPRKGLEYLAEALAYIQPAPRLVIVGRWSAVFREKFYNLAGSAREGIIEAGFVPDAEMPLYFSMADVYVSPSMLEGFGLPLAEALACGTPVVAAQGGATAEVVGPGGLLVPPRDASALASAISELLQDGDQRLWLGGRGREYIASQFSLKKMVDSTLDAYAKFA